MTVTARRPRRRFAELDAALTNQREVLLDTLRYNDELRHELAECRQQLSETCYELRKLRRLAGRDRPVAS